MMPLHEHLFLGLLTGASGRVWEWIPIVIAMNSPSIHLFFGTYIHSLTPPQAPAGFWVSLGSLTRVHNAYTGIGFVGKLNTEP